PHVFLVHAFHVCCPLFFSHDPATTEIYTLSLTTLFRSHHLVHRLAPVAGVAPQVVQVQHDAAVAGLGHGREEVAIAHLASLGVQDRKSTRLNSSHVKISYAVFCLKKKTHDTTETHPIAI